MTMTLTCSPLFVLYRCMKGDHIQAFKGVYCYFPSGMLIFILFNQCIVSYTAVLELIPIESGTFWPQVFKDRLKQVKNNGKAISRDKNIITLRCMGSSDSGRSIHPHHDLLQWLTLDTALHHHGNLPQLSSITAESFAQTPLAFCFTKITDLWTVPEVTLDVSLFAQSHLDKWFLIH